MADFKSAAVFDQIKSGLEGMSEDEKKKNMKQVNGIFEMRVKNAAGKEGIWTIDLKKEGKVYEGNAKPKADVTINVSDDTFQDLADGKLGGQKAFMSGKLKVKGNIMLATKLDTVLKSAQSKLYRATLNLYAACTYVETASSTLASSLPLEPRPSPNALSHCSPSLMLNGFNDTVTALHERLVGRQRALKLKSEEGRQPSLDIDAAFDTLRDAFSHLEHDVDDASSRADHQLSLLSSLSLLFSLARLESGSSVRQDDAREAMDIVWRTWPARGAGLTMTRCKEALQNLVSLPGRAGEAAATHLLQLCVDSSFSGKRALHCLLQLVEGGQLEAVRKAYPNLMEDCVDQLSVPEASAPASRICVAAICAELPKDSDEVEAFVPLLRRAILRSREGVAARTGVQLVPMIAKSRPKLFRALFTDISKTGADHLSTFLSLAQNGLSAGLLKREDISDDLMLSCIRHSDGSIRSAVIVLLADPPSVVARFTDIDFQILSEWWHYDMGPSDPDFRQVVNGAWVKLLGRLRSSSYAAHRTSMSAKRAGYTDEEGEAYVNASRRLLEEVTASFHAALQPYSPYRVQRNSLIGLLALFMSGIDPSYQGELDRAARTAKDQMATQPTAGALWPFRISLCDDARFVRSLVRCLMSTYDDVRDAAFALLLDCPRPLPGFEDVETVEKELLEPAMELLRNRRESESTSGALLVELCLRAVDAPSFGGAALLHRILDAAEEDVAVAEVDLARAAQTNPIHGNLIGARQILTALFSSKVALPKQTYARTLELVERTWQATEPVLVHASPEGRDVEVPDHEDARALQSAGDGIEGDLEVYDEGAGPRHKVLLSASWRATKEAASFLEASLLLPLEAGLLEQVWAFDQVNTAGEFFATWLLQIRHRGAFSAIYPSYGRLCRALIGYKGWPAVADLPERWLRTHLADLQHRSVSTTRRSAGLPYCILGALTGVVNTAPQLVSSTMSQLLDIADSASALDDVRIHAMNALMILYADAELATALHPSVEAGFTVAIHSFSSTSWGVRNVATLLFASSVQRALGARVNTLSIEQQTGAKRTSSHDFFRRYPKLQPILLRELAMGVRDHLNDLPTLDMQSSLFSILLLISLLNTPACVPGFHDLCFAFVPLIEACATSRVWRIREAAAQALAAMLAPEDLAARLDRSWSTLSVLRSENELHGRLLQILRPLQRVELEADQLESFIPMFDKQGARLLDRHAPPVQTAVLEIARSLALHANWSLSVFASSCLAHARQTVNSPTNGHADLAHDSHLLACTRLLLQHDAEHAISLCISSPSTTVLRSALERLAAGQTTLGKDNIRQLARLASAAAPTPQIRLLALAALDKASAAPEDQAFEATLVELQQTRILPLKQRLLPILARQAKTEHQSSVVLKLIDAATDDDETEEARASGVSALSALRLRPSSWHRILLRILQDDDPAIREQAERAAEAHFATGPFHGLRHIEAVVRALVDLQGADVIAADLLLDDCDLLLDRLSKPVEQLFAKERSNLHKDDVFELAALLRCADESTWSMTTSALRPILERLQLFLQDRELRTLGLASTVAWSLLAYKVVKAYETVGGGEGELNAYKKLVETLASS